MKYLVKKGGSNVLLYAAPTLNDFKSHLVVYIYSQVVLITGYKTENEKELEKVNKDIEKELYKIIELTSSNNEYCNDFIINKIMLIGDTINKLSHAKQYLLDTITQKESNIFVLQGFIKKIKSCTNYETIIGAINDEYIMDFIDMSDFEWVEAKSQNDFTRDIMPKKHNCCKTPVVTKFLDDEDPEFGWDQ